MDAYYGPSSFTINITVQQDPVQPIPQTPLPTDYWTRPINAQNQEWYTISGNWFGTGLGEFGTSMYNASGNFNPYTTAPNTAHIVWAKPLLYGGLIGGEFGGTPASNYYNGKNYEPAFTPPVIINGVLYINDPDPPKQGFSAIDLRTGETLWHQNASSTITNGQVLNFMIDLVSPNQVGGIPYLWSTSGTTWYMYNAVNGNLILTFANATPALGGNPSGSAGSVIQGPKGELLYYVLDAGNNWLALWNSTLCVQGGSSGSLRAGTNSAQWRPEAGSTLNWLEGIQWNVTTNSYPGQHIDRIDSGVLLATTGSHFIQTSTQMEIGYSMTTGQELWAEERTLFEGATDFGLLGAAAKGVYTEFHSSTMQWYGYSINTGEKVWGPSKPYTNAWDSIADNDVTAQSAYGILYSQSIAGIHALNITTGERLFDYYAESSGVDFPGFNTYPFECNMLYSIADGKVIASTGNSHGNPLYRGARLYVFDAFSGETVWSVNGYYQQSLPVADGYLIGFNLYDNQLYCFGKGQTSTTVSASPEVSVHGSSILIKGTVLDQSSGAAGTAAIADEYQSPWMEYLYMQQPKPTNVTGVPVSIDVLDANGNYRNIGNATSDATGLYSFAWEPDIPGKYTVIATFAGSESYWSSMAETAFNVEEAPAATPAPTPGPQSAADLYFVPAVIGLLVAIIIVGVVMVLMLRKR